MINNKSLNLLRWEPKITPYFCLTLLLMMSFGCGNSVGALKEKLEKVALDDSVNPQETQLKLTFGTPVEGFAVSDTRVKVCFLPATGGSDSYEYVVELTDIITTFSTIRRVKSFLLSPDYLGRLCINFYDLSKGRRYIITAHAEDLLFGTESATTDPVFVETLNSFFPVFDGVVKVENVVGSKGTSIRVFWDLCQPSPQALAQDGANLHHIISFYKIWYDTSESGLIAQLNANAGGISVAHPLTQFDITGTSPNTTYYVAVRCQNTETVTPVQPALLDQNEVIFQFTTEDAKPLEFAGIKRLVLPTSSIGYTSLRAEWDMAQGHVKYLVFVKNSPDPVDPGVDTPTATITDLEATSYDVLGLLPHNTYFVTVVACEFLDDCSVTKAKGQSKTLFQTTSPPIVNYPGIGSANSFGSINTIQLSWPALDLTSGVCDEIQLHLVDETGTPLDHDSSQAGVQSRISTDQSGGKIYINNPTELGCSSLGTTVHFPMGMISQDDLINGKEFFFAAVACETVNKKAGVDDCGDNILTPVSGSIQIESPVFNGLNAIADLANDVSSTSMKVSWTHPTSGSFDWYYLYYAIQSELSPDANASAADYFSEAYDDIVNNGATISTGISRGNVFTRIKFQYNLATGEMLLPNGSPFLSFPYEITGLIPDTAYKLGIVPYFNLDGDAVTSEDPDDIVYPGNIIRIVTTKKPRVLHQGFEEIFAVGPKVNGLTGALIPETLQVDVKNNIFVIREDQAQGGTDGIVYLRWRDFELDSGSTVSQLTSTLDISYVISRSIQPNSGFVEVGRVAAAAIPTFNPADPYTSVQNKFYEFIDQKASYALSGSYPERTIASDVYYRIDIDYGNNGNILEFVDSNAINASHEVIKVTVPPQNMALVHRWMANKTTCDRINNNITATPGLFSENRPLYFSENRNYDLEENYRCAWEGMGSTLIDGEYFYDLGHSYLVDRFELGCNFTRNAVDDSNNSVTCGNHLSSNDCFGSMSPNRTDQDNDDRSGRDGGSMRLDDDYQARTGSVYYQRDDQACYVKIGSFPYTALFSTGDNRNRHCVGIESNWANENDCSWMRVGASFDIYENDNGLQGMLTQTDIGGRELAQFDNPSLAASYLPSAITNNAYMPPLGGLTVRDVPFICGARKVRVNAGGVNELTIQMEGLTRKLQLPASQFHEGIDNDALVSIWHNQAKQSGSCNTYTDRTSTTDRVNAPNTGAISYTAPSDNFFMYPKYSDNDGAPIATGSYAQSATDLYASSNCVSKFGLHDMVGNMHELLLDTYECATPGTASTCSFNTLNPISAEAKNFWRDSSGTFGDFQNIFEYSSSDWGLRELTPSGISWSGNILVDPVVGMFKITPTHVPGNCGTGDLECVFGAERDKVINYMFPLATQNRPRRGVQFANNSFNQLSAGASYQGDERFPASPHAIHTSGTNNDTNRSKFDNDTDHGLRCAAKLPN